MVGPSWRHPTRCGGGRPRLIEWTGGRRPPGDEVAPVDLRIDHVYLVSCKYLSRNIANPSPARLFEGLLATSGDWDQTDWYLRTAPDEYRALYRSCRSATGLDDLPDDPDALTPVERRSLRKALPGGRIRPTPRSTTGALCARVSAGLGRAVAGERGRPAAPGTSGLASVAHRQRHLLPVGGRRQTVITTAGGQPLGLAPVIRIPRPRHPGRQSGAAPGGLVGDLPGAGHAPAQ